MSSTATLATATESKASGCYSACLVRPQGEIEELYLGEDLALATEAGRRAHERTGYRTWVANARTDKTLLRFGGTAAERYEDRRRVGGGL